MPMTVIVVQIPKCALIAQVEFRSEAKQECLALKLSEAEPLAHDGERHAVRFRGDCGPDSGPADRGVRILRRGCILLFEQFNHCIPADGEPGQLVARSAALARNAAFEQCVEPKARRLECLGIRGPRSCSGFGRGDVRMEEPRVRGRIGRAHEST
ncbi:hypothetical protein V1274_001794 [Bradyrhizobium sp. AZCC 1614]